MHGIFINSDAWNFWLDTTTNCMNEQAVRDDVDFYVSGGGVEAIFYNMNFQRSFFPTNVGTPYWKDCSVDNNGQLLLRSKYVEDNNGDYLTMFKNVTAMMKNCPEFMKLRYKYCHEKGVEMWHSMRMNDVHWTTLGSEHRPQHSDLWMERKDLLRAWYRHTWRGDWHDNAFDYGKQEVYDYHLAMVREYLINFESDGIELDWLRSVPVFKPGFDETNKEIMTRFMRNVRKIADEAAIKWGHHMRIAVRVPGYVTDAMGAGMDIPTWCSEKLIDVLVPSPANVSTEQDAQIELWRILAPRPIILAPCIDYNMTSNPGWAITFTMDTDCGFASNFYQQGADTIYTYNHFPRHKTIFPDIKEFFSIAGKREAVAARKRRHVVTRHDALGEGKFNIMCYPQAIWHECCNGGVKINVGENSAGREARIVIGAKVPLDIDILLNTNKCTVLPSDTPLQNNVPNRDDEQAWFVQASIPPNTLHDGWNSVEIFNHSEHTIVSDEFVWMEICIEPRT